MLGLPRNDDDCVLPIFKIFDALFSEPNTNRCRRSAHRSAAKYGYNCDNFPLHNWDIPSIRPYLTDPRLLHVNGLACMQALPRDRLILQSFQNPSTGQVGERCVRNGRFFKLDWFANPKIPRVAEDSWAMQVSCHGNTTPWTPGLRLLTTNIQPCNLINGFCQTIFEWAELKSRRLLQTWMIWTASTW